MTKAVPASATARAGTSLSWVTLALMTTSSGSQPALRAHHPSLRDPGRQYPRAMLLAVLLVLLIFIVPAVLISWVVPADEIGRTAGVIGYGCDGSADSVFVPTAAQTALEDGIRWSDRDERIG
ncbi:hypothetical protein NDR87_05200 [Nocardia sp. CDC159]|uniref:Uncharacterized protein n=1 Tax=Nocardia pulmonis TaxID=2951408 RepID=A0A9X2IVX4_9NOCA|nr:MULTISPECIES: hypothetical protein [Nocardia]MCM6772944.1 hypothetical protein [Nocardia pulmonis]MCM6785753.1 hypothetical protein [Nocardia sp. CDC159]